MNLLAGLKSIPALKIRDEPRCTSLFVRFCLVLFMLGRVPSGMYSSILTTRPGRVNLFADYFCQFSIFFAEGVHRAEKPKLQPE